MKFKLINPLLGSNCYIGSDETPIVVNPSLSVGEHSVKHQITMSKLKSLLSPGG